MKTITVGDLIKQLRRHPNHTPVFQTNGEFKPLRAVEEVRLHGTLEAVYILGGEIADELPPATDGKSIPETKKEKKPRGRNGNKKKSAAPDPNCPFIPCPNPDCSNGEVEDNGPRACPTCGGNGWIDNPNYALSDNEATVAREAKDEQADSVRGNDDKGNNDQQGPVDYINACVCLAGHRKCNGDCARQPFGGPLK